MRSIICLPVDFGVNQFGLPSMLGEEIDGAPVLFHTVSRLALSEDYRVVLLFRAGPGAEDQARKAREILAGLPCEYLVSAAPDVPNRDLVLRARLWSLDSWRGGIAGTTYADEAGAPGALREAAERFGAEAVGLMTADSPFADPRLSERMFRWHYDHIRNARVTITAVPPGLAPAIVNVDTLSAMAAANLTLSATMSYKAAKPEKELSATEAHFEADLELRLAPWRLTCHSVRQLAMLRALAAAGVSPRSARSIEVVRALASNRSLVAGDAPRKLEIEPTTRFDVAPFYLREALSARPRAQMGVEAFEKIMASLAPHRDMVVSLEGLGDAMAHPDLPALVAAAKRRALGVHAGTAGRRLDTAAFKALVAARLDILSVAVGAHTEESYGTLYGADGLAGVKAAVEAAYRYRIEEAAAWPLVAAEITKIRALEGDIEPFFDHWMGRSDWPVIRPYNDFAGQLDDFATIHMRTSTRLPCRKIFEELYIDAEGIAWPCRQDIRRTRPLGSAVREGVPALWRSEFMERLRAAQAAGDYGFFPLCKGCGEGYYV